MLTAPCNLLCWQVHLCEGKKDNNVDNNSTVQIIIIVEAKKVEAAWPSG